MISSFDNLTFRCSALGSLMTEPRSKSETISETTKTYLIEKFISERYGREKDISSKYTDKGLQVEELAMNLYCKISGGLSFKNQEYFRSEFITGTPDIVKPDLIIDLKSSWNLWTFWKARTQPLDKMYYWQLQGYMALTGARKAQVVYCLIDTPEAISEQEKRRLMYSMGVADPFTDEVYQEACKAIDREMMFSDIADSERIFTFDLEYNQEDIDRLYSRIADCRKWMNEELLPIFAKLEAV